MKRFFFLMLLCSPLLFTSCEENYYGAYVDTYYVTVRPNQWYEVGNYGEPGYIWEASFRVDYITAEALDNGAVIAYSVYPDGNIQLPDVIANSEGRYDFVEVLTYIVEPGRITFTKEASNFVTKPYDVDKKFKIVVIR